MIWHKNIIEFYFGIFWFLTKIFRLWFIILYVIKIFRVGSIWLNLSQNFKRRYIAKHDHSLSKCALIWEMEQNSAHWIFSWLSAIMPCHCRGVEKNIIFNYFSFSHWRLWFNLFIKLVKSPIRLRWL